MAVIYMDRRSAGIHVARSTLAAAAEDALAASRMAQSAIERAERHAWSGHRAGVIHELGRIGFELQARLEALSTLTELAESSATCPDHQAKPGHGRASGCESGLFSASWRIAGSPAPAFRLRHPQT